MEPSSGPSQSATGVLYDDRYHLGLGLLLSRFIARPTNPTKNKSDPASATAKPSKMFEPVENRYWVKARIRFKSHNEVVYAGLNPIDWMELKVEEDATLHKTVLTKQQAELCVVAEGLFRPTDEELTEFIERKHIADIGSYREYEYENYEKSFVPLLEYSGGYDLPEVLIPSIVRAETVSCVKM